MGKTKQIEYMEINGKLYEVHEHVLDQPYGFYDILNERISVHKDLKKFPELRKKVLEHEAGHVNDKNMLQVLRREIRDYPRIFASKEFEEFDNYLKRNEPKSISKQLLLMLVSTVYGVSIIFIYFFARGYGLIARLSRKKK